MSNQLPEDLISFSSNTYYSPIDQVESQHGKNDQIARNLDTITAAQNSEKWNDKLNGTAGSSPLSLPAPGASKDPDALTILAAAFCKAFSAMSEGSISEIKNFAELQQLDQTMSQAILLTTKEAIDKQENLLKEQTQLNDYMAAIATKSSILTWVLFGLGILLLAATAGTAAVGSPALAGVLGEEIVGEEVAGGLGEEAIELSQLEVTNEISTLALPAENLATTVTDSTESLVSVTGALDEPSTTVTEIVEKAVQETTDLAATDPAINAMESLVPVTDAVDESSAATAVTNVADKTVEGAAGKSAFSEWLDTLDWKKMLGNMAASTVFGTPGLTRGVSSLYIEEALKKVAGAQAEVGTATAKMQIISMDFQFYQQLVQRQASILNEETSNASEVIDTFAKISSAYRQISASA